MMSLNVLHEKGPLMPFTQDLIGVFVTRALVTVVHLPVIVVPPKRKCSKLAVN